MQKVMTADSIQAKQALPQKGKPQKTQTTIDDFQNTTNLSESSNSLNSNYNQIPGRTTENDDVLPNHIDHIIDRMSQNPKSQKQMPNQHSQESDESPNKSDGNKDQSNENRFSSNNDEVSVKLVGEPSEFQRVYGSILITKDNEQIYKKYKDQLDST